MNLEQTIEMFQQAKNRKQSIQTLLDECYQYFLPLYETSQKSLHIYDSTGILSLQAFATHLKDKLLPSWRKWCKIVLTDHQMEKLKKSLAALDPVELQQKIDSRITNPFFDALNHSNFDAEIGQALLELGLGTGALLINEGTFDKPLRFSAVSIRELILEESAQGEIENVFRERSLEIGKIRQLWPEARLPDSYLARPQAQIPILEATLFSPASQQYLYQVIDLQHQELLYQGSFAVSPWVIFRWSKIAGEVYGRGPAMLCLSDVKEANKIKELSAQNAVLNLLPTYMVASDGVLNPQLFEIKPGSLIPVRSLASGSPIQPLPRGSDFNLGQLNLESARNIIRSTLLADLWALNDTTKKTATEVRLRYEEAARYIGSSFGRLQTELVEKLVKRCLYILQKKGITYPVVLNGKELTLKILSPLNQSQQQEDLEALERILPYYQSFPDEFRLKIKTEEIPNFVAEKASVPSNLLRSEKERKVLAQELLRLQELEQNRPKPKTNKAKT